VCRAWEQTCKSDGGLVTDVRASQLTVVGAASRFIAPIPSWCEQFRQRHRDAMRYFAAAPAPENVVGGVQQQNVRGLPQGIQLLKSGQPEAPPQCKLIRPTPK
jgi:hypothetical protein